MPDVDVCLPRVQLLTQSRPVLHLAVASARRFLSGDYVWRQNEHDRTADHCIFSRPRAYPGHTLFCHQANGASRA